MAKGPIQFHNLTTGDQMVYFDWMNALIEDGQIDPSIDNDDYIDKMERMHKCDVNQTEPIGLSLTETIILTQTKRRIYNGKEKHTRNNN